jgi:hypothetical protein
MMNVAFARCLQSAGWSSVSAWMFALVSWLFAVRVWMSARFCCFLVRATVRNRNEWCTMSCLLHTCRVDTSDAEYGYLVKLCISRGVVHELSDQKYVCVLFKHHHHTRKYRPRPANLCALSRLAHTLHVYIKFTAQHVVASCEISIGKSSLHQSRFRTH